jgi:glycosyltransferase domain-containing protein
MAYCEKSTTINTDLSKITLLILSRNRQHCLKETLQFYRSTNLNILVLDNSPEPLDLHYVPENCRYINLKLDFAQRCAKAVELIDTPYTIIGADDELYIPESLNVMQEFLDLNPNYVAVGGYAIAVWRYGPSIAANWAYQRTYKYHNEGETPYERIRVHTGEGVNPLTSFFTCNLTRTSIAKSCLEVYSKAPVLATDAISVFTICGAGKSKYLDLVYWVRNWNQSPKSHTGWNRNSFLHEWWSDSANNVEQDIFEKVLESTYIGFSIDGKFKESWQLILDSDKVMRTHVRNRNSRLVTFGEYPNVKWLKYVLKKTFKSKSLPTTHETVLEEFRRLNIEFAPLSTTLACQLVSKLLPYKNWLK